MSEMSTTFSAHTLIAAYSKGWLPEKDQNYKAAIMCLNKLHPALSNESINLEQNQKEKFKDTTYYLKKSGLTLEKLDELSVIHVTGTKGKGSTCALTETILRSHGVKTGFLSSPHLISVTECIRINGVPVSERLFSNYFWKVWNKLELDKETGYDLRAYFRFLTILSFHIFLGEKVDAAILEVGIGGEYDPTNIIRNTKTVGITTIGIDHTSILGTTLEDIAWQKSGIVKERANVFTGVKQELCLKIIKQRCNEKKANLLEIPHVNLDNWTTKEVVKINTPLSVCLAYDWLTRTTKNKINGIGINILSNQNNFHKFLSTVLKQLENFQFPGRCQNVKIRNLNFYLDGAHTIESIILASRWFIESTKGSSNEKVLVFNLTGDRDPLKLMKVLYENCKLSLVCFTPNTPYIDDDLNSNFNNFSVISEVDKMKNVTKIAESCRNNFKLNSMVFTHILKVFEYISKRFGNEEVDVLVTGSLYLIGATLVALEKFSSNTRFE